MTSPSPVSSKSLHMDVGGLSCHVSISGTQRWAFGWSFLFLSVCLRAYLDCCEEHSSKTSWFLILCPDCALSPLLSSQRSKALCVWLNSSPHYLPSTLVHCRLGLLFGLQFFAFHSQSQISIPLTLFEMFRIKSSISYSFWVCCPLFISFFYLHWFFFTLKNTYTFPWRGRYPLILQEIEKKFL